MRPGYISAKHGLIGLTRTAALEGGEHGITVNAICPAYVRTPPGQRDMKAIGEKQNKAGQMLGILDAALADRHYVAGAFSMGDIPIGCHVQLWMRLPIERPRQPNLEAWFERLCARTAFKKIVDIPLT